MQPVTVGAVIAGFRIESHIGEGAMGSVYVAEDTRRGGRAAVKVLSAALADDERFRQRFLRESQVAAGLAHPHIVPTLAAGEHDGLLYLAMAYVAGSDLRQILKREGALEASRALRIVSHVADALDAAHGLGLVHRDVKPGNILVATDEEGEQAFVCDFGLARHVSSVSSLTGERGFVGTIDYVPPEQIRGEPVDGRADLYSLGCVLFECLAGARPFERESELSSLFAHLNEPPPLLSDFNPELPSALDDVIATALAKAPDERYSTCGELVAHARLALAGEAFSRPRRRRPYRRVLVAAAALAVAACAATVAIFGWGGSSGVKTSPVIDLRPNTLGLIDARTHQVVSHIGLGPTSRFGAAAWDIAFTESSAWVLSGAAQRLERIDLKSHRLAQIVRLPWSPGLRLALGKGSLWLTEDAGSEVTRIDARSGKVLRRFSVAGRGAGIAFGAGSLWLARDDAVARVDPESGRVLRRLTISDNPVSWVVYADGAVWAASGGDGAIAKIDPVDDRIVETARLHGYLSDLVVGGGFVWATTVPDGTLFQLSEDDLGVQKPTPAGPDPERISFGDDGLWIANSAVHAISLRDPNTGTRSQFATAAEPLVVRSHNGLLWASAKTPLTRLPAIAGQELRISTPTAFTDADPSTARPSPHNQQLFYEVCGNLLGFPDASGAAGRELRPELAAAMPTLSRDGRTYTFRIRRGIHFSPPSNELVSPQTFRHTIERALSPRLEGAPGMRFADDIVGVTAFRAGEAAHIAGIKTRGDLLSITLVRPSGDFLARISLYYFCPVPLSQPVVPGGLTGPIPSLGPYYVKSMSDASTVLVRNPNYTGTRPRRSARIVYTFGTPTPQAVAQIEAGTLDLLPTDFDKHSLLAPGGVLARSNGPQSPAARGGRQRYFVEPLPFVDMIVFNTKRTLFRELRLRRAVSLALDRRALAAAWGDAPADGLVPPAVPGFRPGRFYRLEGPDVAGARRLAGHTRRRAVLLACGTSAHLGVAEIVRANLAKIGIAVSIVRTQACPGRYDARSERADLVLAGAAFGGVERDPKWYFEQTVASGTYGSALGAGPWSAASFRERVRSAAALRGGVRTRAYRRLHDELMRAVPFAVYGSVMIPEYVSPKVGCKLFQGHFGFLDLGALCIRA